MSSGSSGHVLKNLFTCNSLEARKSLLEDSTSKLYNAERINNGDGDALEVEERAYVKSRNIQAEKDDVDPFTGKRAIDGLLLKISDDILNDFNKYDITSFANKAKNFAGADTSESRYFIIKYIYDSNPVAAKAFSAASAAANQKDALTAAATIVVINAYKDNNVDTAGTIIGSIVDNIVRNNGDVNAITDSIRSYKDNDIRTLIKIYDEDAAADIFSAAVVGRAAAASAADVDADTGFDWDTRIKDACVKAAAAAAAAAVPYTLGSGDRAAFTAAVKAAEDAGVKFTVNIYFESTINAVAGLNMKFLFLTPLMYIWNDFENHNITSFTNRVIYFIQEGYITIQCLNVIIKYMNDENILAAKAFSIADKEFAAIEATASDAAKRKALLTPVAKMVVINAYNDDNVNTVGTIIGSIAFDIFINNGDVKAITDSIRIDAAAAADVFLAAAAAARLESNYIRISRISRFSINFNARIKNTVIEAATAKAKKIRAADDAFAVFDTDYTGLDEKAADDADADDDAITLKELESILKPFSKELKKIEKSTRPS